MPEFISPLRSLSDNELVQSLKAHVSQERECVADVVEHLAEMDRRELTLDFGFPSLFVYCQKALGYSEAETFLRIRAARAATKFPRVLADLRAGRIHLSALASMVPHLTDENSDSLLETISGASRKEVLTLVAELGGESPKERDIVTPVPAAAPPAGPVETTTDAQIVPSPRMRLQFTADTELLDMLDRLRGLLRNKYPDGRFESIIKEAANALLDRIDPNRRTTKAKTVKQSGKSSRLVPAAVKKAVWARDQGRCSYTAEDGRRCESSDALEYDHVVPWAVGGRSDTAENIRLLCRPHNQRLGRKRFGDHRTGMHTRCFRKQ